MPELETYGFAVHLVIAAYGEEDLGLVGDFVKVHICHTDALVVIECNHLVVVVGVEDVADLHLSAERHVIRVLARFGFVVRALGCYLDLDKQRFG